jgi:sugar/nucleoside kinase (ribokinase family)
MKILVIGEINPDFILSNYDQFPVPGREVLVEDTSLVLGSASCICAAGLARLGHEVAMLGKVGRDPWGDFCLERLRALNVDTRLVVRDAGVKTGITVSISAPRDRALVTYLGAMERFGARDFDTALFGGFRHLHLSSYYMQHGLRPDVGKLFAVAHEAGLTTSLDTGYDPAERWDGGLRESLGETDVFLPNEVELAAITSEKTVAAGLRALQNGRTLVVAKLGAKGAMTLEGGEAIHVEAARIQPVDTTGAGDSFNAGFLHAWLSRRPLADALRFASACGSLSTLALGGTGAQAREAEALRFIESHTLEVTRGVAF